MDIIQRSTPYYTASGKKQPPLGLVVHNTVTQSYVEPRIQGSWHYEGDRDGKVYQFVNDFDYAWHVRATDRWQPSWMHRRSNAVSLANSCTLGYELVSFAGSPQKPAGYLAYTDEQYVSLREWFDLMYTRYGSLPIVGHGQVQADRSDPVLLDWARAGCTWVEGWGYLFAESPEEFDLEEYVAEQMALRETEIVAYLGQLGVPINPETAIYKRAARAYVLGETRGPAVSGEYPHGDHVRQDFTAGKADYYNGVTNWAEVVAEG